MEISNSFPVRNAPELTLQGLDRWLPFENTDKVPGGRLFYASGNFTGTESAWNGTKIVLVPPGKPVMHVDHAAFSRDPYSEPARNGYRIVGELNNTRIVNGTMPDLVADANVLDTETTRLIAGGKLTLSTGFDAEVQPDGYISGRVRPNHVLLFTKCSAEKTATCGIPRDQAARIDNTEGKPAGGTDRVVFPERGSNDKLDMVRARGKLNPFTGTFEGPE
ncbi:MAG: hypothetical protein GYA23_01910 [Methanomicrobiales archaeon]|nr:hypothetical protein [Methanomicrobiales archaeon]